MLTMQRSLLKLTSESLKLKSKLEGSYDSKRLTISEPKLKADWTRKTKLATRKFQMASDSLSLSTTTSRQRLGFQLEELQRRAQASTEQRMQELDS